MNLATFKLESFTDALAVEAGNSAPGIDVAEQAFADGLAAGLARKEDAEIRSLRAGLDSLARSLAADEARRITLRGEAVAALAPLLEQVLDCVLPAADSRRLEAALTQELTRLSQSAAPIHARISCNARLRAMVERCLAETGLDGVELLETDTNCIGLTLHGGRIELSADKTAQDIRALIREITEGTPEWTN